MFFAYLPFCRFSPRGAVVRREDHSSEAFRWINYFGLDVLFLSVFLEPPVCDSFSSSSELCSSPAPRSDSNCLARPAAPPPGGRCFVSPGRLMIFSWNSYGACLENTRGR